MAASEGAAFSGQTAGIKTMIPIHSPAPWSIRFDRIEDATGKQVAQITPRLTGEQNHKLIAAAPELLAALESLVADFERIIGRSIEVEHEAKAVIAKANGGAL
jgi:hypothetical protein